MCRRFPTAILIVLFAAAAYAQDRGNISNMLKLNSAIQNQWVQFSIAGGRINMQGIQMAAMETGPYSANRKDHLTLRTENGDVVMTYEWANAKEQFLIDASSSSQLHIQRGPKPPPAPAASNPGNKPRFWEVNPLAEKANEAKNGASNDAGRVRAEPLLAGSSDEKRQALKVGEAGPIVDFEQTPQSKAVLTIAVDGDRQVFAAADLWHLFVLYPQPARKHLMPLLEPLLPSWRFAETADNIEKLLLANADGGVAIDRANWARWVAELGDENFARRQAADRSLRAANPALLVYLQQLDFDRLDAEQQFRIRRIIDMLSEKVDIDSPEQVASWLSGDTSVWLALLTRPDVAARRVAAKQLAAIVGGPIPVDPEAEPASQKAKLDELRAQLEAPEKQ